MTDPAATTDDHSSRRHYRQPIPDRDEAIMLRDPDAIADRDRSAFGIRGALVSRDGPGSRPCDARETGRRVGCVEAASAPTSAQSCCEDGDKGGGGCVLSGALGESSGEVLGVLLTHQVGRLVRRERCPVFGDGEGGDGDDQSQHSGAFKK